MDADLKLPDREAEDESDGDEADTSEGLGELLGRFRSVLQDHVSEVRVSERLTDSPVCLVLPEGGLPPHLERLLRAREGGAAESKRILEVNPTHPLIASLNAMTRQSGADDDVRAYIEVLYDQARLSEGSPIEDPTRLVGRLTELLTAAAAQRAGAQAPKESRSDEHA
jgi:molecular chaperone HtpG